MPLTRLEGPQLLQPPQAPAPPPAANGSRLVLLVEDEPEVRKVIRLQLTETAARCLQSLTELHLKELESFSAESPLGL